MNQLIVLAGGKGTRMQTDIPKVLFPVAGVPIIKWLLKSSENFFPQPVIVVGYKGEEVKSSLGNKYEYVWQYEQKGTGHALMCAGNAARKFKNIVVLPGDHLLISEKTIANLLKIKTAKNCAISLATVRIPNFNGAFSVFNSCGRIVRNSSEEIVGIVEYKNASAEERKITEINVSYYCFDGEWLWNNLPKIQNLNFQGEIYLTDIVKIAAESGEKISSFQIENPYEGMGVNNREQATVVENYLSSINESAQVVNVLI